MIIIHILIPILGLFLLTPFTYERPNYGEVRKTVPWWVTTLKLLVSFIILVAIAGSLLLPVWKTDAVQNALAYIDLGLILGGVIFIIAAIVLDIKNPPNNYSLKKRFLKYTFQEFSFMLMSLAVFVLCLRYPFPGQDGATHPVISYIALTVALLGLYEASKRVGTTVFYLISFIHPPDLKQNGKTMKALRKTNLR